ncbi:MAG: ankyrin repeat domain-containing protein [Acidimicrobiales bacterium]
MSERGDVADSVAGAIHGGDVDGLRQLLSDHADLASLPVPGPFGKRTPLHLVADWPGYFPNGPEVVKVLVAAGADPNEGEPGQESALHWAASSDDVHVAAALIDAGADINAPDGSIGTPLANAVGYSCWEVARLLVARGARVEQPWQAAALGLLDRLAQLLGADPLGDEVSKAFWHACAGGQRRAAEYLLLRGADPNWIPDYAEGTPLDAAGGLGTQRENLIGWLREHGGHEQGSGGATP